MNIEQLQAIADQSAETLKVLFMDMSDDIQAAALAAFEISQTEEKEACKVTISHAIELDLVKLMVKDSLSVSVRHKSSCVNMMPDPNQLELPLEVEA